MDPNFDRPVFPKFEAPWVEDLPYMLETYRGGPRPIRLCVEKTKILVKFNHLEAKMDPNFDLPIFPKFEAPWVEHQPYMLETCSEALGLFDCVLKRLKILVKFNHRRPGRQNGPKSWSARFSQIWRTLSRETALPAWNLQGRC